MTFARKRQEWLERKEAERRANFSLLGQPRRNPLHRGTYGGSTTGPAPKTEAYRDDALLQMAKDRPCLLMLPAVCNHRTDTTVAAHSNLGEHGKAKARKADDHYSAWACFSCHLWLDTGKASAEFKRDAFMAAHARQVLAWRLVAADAREPDRFRAAARRALEALNAAPIPEEA